TYTPPTFQDIGQFVDREPEISIQPDGQPATVAAVDSVNEAGLPTRNSGEPAGSGESADGNSADNDDPSEATTGTILIDSPDDPSVVSITVNGVTTAVTSVGQVIAGVYGNLTITSISDTAVGYSYVLRDNTSGDTTRDDFSVTVTDRDGDTATATLTINIVDDVPFARPDTDSIAAGSLGPATGNLITDAAPGDAGDGDNGADTVGADNATLTSISGAGGSDSTFSGGVLQVNGQYGVLTVDAQGNYSYARNANSAGGVTDTFNYTITDGDGDPSSSTLTITIADRLVTVGPNLLVRTDDDAVPGAGGNPGGTGDDVDAENLTGTLSGSGGDGPLTFDLLTTGAPAGFTYVDGPGGSVLVQQGGVTVLTITVNASTGAYTVTQNAPIDHPAGGDENNLSFTINYTVTDVDGDSAPGTLTINVDDDTPVITRADVSAPTLTVDETDLATNASGNFSTLFSVSYGADGPGTTVYSVSVVNGTDSGLNDVATGQDILLFNNAGVVEGRVGGASGAVAFTVSVNSTTGVVTLDQVRALQHPDATNPDDPVSPTATSIQLTVTATDGDGDPASQTVNIGGNLVFEDDGPSLTNAAAASGVLLDETTAGTPAGFPISATSASAMITASQAFGADGAGTVVYGLSLNGTASGL
ncbi:MAG: DUF5801 domain-containing protein, partial [Actinobacteria bacterium]|nr:DUF5801 domain-containing protein [Actinomycetota bacterium]